MSRRDNSSYYSFRAVEELQRGDQAVSATVAAAHYELAYRYGILAANKTDTGTPKLTVVEGGKVQLAA